MTCKTRIAMIFSAALTAGCAIDTLSLYDECDWSEPIRPSRQDVLSDVTLAQIVAHNEVGARLCGWRP
jgi:hypothetical protein